MAAVRIYHNPRCSKSRETLEIIRQAGIEPEIIEYLKTPPDAKTLSGLLTNLGMLPRDIMRRAEEPYKTLKLDDAEKDNQALITAMVENPILIERPIVVTQKGVRLCRPPEKVKEIL